MTGTRTRRRRPEVVAFGVLFTMLAVYFGYASVSSFVRQRSAGSYVPVPATITRATVAERGGPNTTRGTTYYADVAYRYAVAGREFTGTRVRWTGTAWSERTLAEQAVTAYPVGGTVTAYHDAQAPERAVLDRSAPPVSLLLFPSAFAAVGLAILAVGLGPVRFR